MGPSNTSAATITGNADIAITCYFGLPLINKNVNNITEMGKPQMLYSSDSDSDSDDGINMELLREAADQDLINDSMFKEVGSTIQKPTSPG